MHTISDQSLIFNHYCGFINNIWPQNAYVATDINAQANKLHVQCIAIIVLVEMVYMA